MKEPTYTLTGIEATAARILQEVQTIFHDTPMDATTSHDWRLEFYIIQVMAADMCIAYELSRDKIMDIVSACHSSTYTKGQITTAFRRLTTRKFLYGTNGTSYSGGESHRSRFYGLKLTRYDTDEVAA